MKTDKLEKEGRKTKKVERGNKMKERSEAEALSVLSYGAPGGAKSSASSFKLERSTQASRKGAGPAATGLHCLYLAARVIHQYLRKKEEKRIEK